MSETTYVYNALLDFPEGNINLTKLKLEIDTSIITSVLNRINMDDNTVYIVFDTPLSVNDKTILDGNITNPAGGLISTHDGSSDIISRYTETLYPRTDNIKSTMWKTIAKYHINGSIRRINSIKIMSYMESGNTSYTIRVYDSTNKTIIAEQVYTNTIEQINDIISLSNLPTDIATIEFQFKVSGNKKMFIDSIILGIL